MLQHHDHRLCTVSLGPGRLARLVLPTDLTLPEAQRLGTQLLTLVVDVAFEEAIVPDDAAIDDLNT